jgi:hypothetical protein
VPADALQKRLEATIFSIIAAFGSKVSQQIIYDFLWLVI